MQSHHTFFKCIKLHQILSQFSAIIFNEDELFPRYFLLLTPNSLLFTCYLLATFYKLLVTFYTLLFTRYFLRVTRYYLLVTFYSLIVTFYSLLLSCYSLFYFSFVTTYSLITNFYSLFLFINFCYFLVKLWKLSDVKNLNIS